MKQRRTALSCRPARTMKALGLGRLEKVIQIVRALLDSPTRSKPHGLIQAILEIGDIPKDSLAYLAGFDHNQFSNMRDLASGLRGNELLRALMSGLSTADVREDPEAMMDGLRYWLEDLIELLAKFEAAAAEYSKAHSLWSAARNARDTSGRPAAMDRISDASLTIADLVYDLCLHVDPNQYWPGGAYLSRGAA